jgi:hypothetical protein
MFFSDPRTNSKFRNSGNSEIPDTFVLREIREIVPTEKHVLQNTPAAGTWNLGKIIFGHFFPKCHKLRAKNAKRKKMQKCPENT